jgi:hypothetical protein
LLYRHAGKQCSDFCLQHRVDLDFAVLPGWYNPTAWPKEALSPGIDCCIALGETLSVLPGEYPFHLMPSLKFWYLYVGVLKHTFTK